MDRFTDFIVWSLFGFCMLFAGFLVFVVAPNKAVWEAKCASLGGVPIQGQCFNQNIFIKVE